MGLNTASRAQRQVPEQRAEGRPRRAKTGRRGVLTFSNLDPNYHYRVVSDMNGKVDEALELGYNFVTGNATLGESKGGEALSLDNRITKIVNPSIGTRGYLMRIPKDWHLEDNKEKAAEVTELENTMKNPNAGRNSFRGLSDE